METELIIEGCGFPPLSARGCRQELTIVEQGAFRRTVNGDLAYVGPKTHKYKSVIRCEDKITLVNEGVLMRGAVVRIGCLQRLWQQGSKGIMTLEREAVDGSITCIDHLQNQQPVRIIDAKSVEVFGDNAFVSYRPWLLMRVVALKLHTDEWDLKAGWSLELEEV
jgi:hypothetical protein